ncbi:hypothetical protein PR202_ga13435 [Eleusine coracana subsp. coracana]|uniref:DUF6598 domain-containing protein n=1 Tax=Eleusine coracana subsp. coracana TaxID=191504 RepID=A0AAV5CE12_ELECO|nr:hypothetical protein PR202_ga13435 [Eleusine coracana subsp. coracana]
MKLRTEAGSSEADSDDERVFAFHKLWVAEWSARWGRLEDVTTILPIPFTDITAPACAYPCRHLQLYSVEVEALRRGGLLTWPVDVYGMVAIRDAADRSLNLVFYRSREDCQTMDGTDRCLELVGPTRAVVVSESLPYPVTVEVELKVRGAVESEDTCLSFVAAPLVDLDHQNPPLSSERRRRSYTSKCSTLTFSFESIASSVEATVFIRVVEGSWQTVLVVRLRPISALLLVNVMRASSYLSLDLTLCSLFVVTVMWSFLAVSSLFQLMMGFSFVLTRGNIVRALQRSVYSSRLRKKVEAVQPFSSAPVNWKSSSFGQLCHLSLMAQWHGVN